MALNVIEANSQLKEPIVKLVNESYWHQQKTFLIDSPQSRERITEKELTKIFRDPNQKVYALFDENFFVGVIAIKIFPRRSFTKIGFFAVDKKHLRKKIGNYLLDYAEKFSTLRGKKQMKLDVLVFAKKLINYYKTKGYSFTGRTASFFHEVCLKPQYHIPNKEYLLEMSKDLIN